MTASSLIPEGVPRLLANFSIVASRPESHIGAYALSCKSCSKDAFHVFSFPKIVKEGEGYSGMNPGETLLRPPHRLVCVACNSGAWVFDPRTDGYDGVLNGGGGYECGSDGEKAADGEYQVIVSLSYGIELTELEELALEAKVAPADLFDWITITASPVAGGDSLILDYECA